MDLQEFGRKLEAYRLESPEVRDERLRDACESFLETLNSLLTKIREPMKPSRLAESLECCKEMLVEQLDFLTGRFGDGIVENDLRSICELRDTVRDLQSLATRGFWGRLFYAQSSHDDLRKQATRQVGVEFCNTYRTLLGHVTGHFHSTEIQQNWQRDCRAFLERFRQRWML